jgi:5'-AMP-activated protein kinase catalytic alpha subunit
LRARLIDFGHAAFYQHPQHRPAIPPFKAYGTPLFAAPEVRSGQSYVGPEGDMYALGLMLYEMNYGDLPDNLDEAFYALGGFSVFEISPRTGFKTAEVRDLCRWMLCPDPNHRATIEEVASHPWFKSGY